MCAAPGSKTAQLLEAVHANQGLARMSSFLNSLIKFYYNRGIGDCK